MKKEPLPLSSLFLFAGWTEEACRQYFASLFPDIRCFRPGETLCSGPEPLHHMVFLLSGTAEILRLGDERPVLLRKAFPGAAFGASALFSDGAAFPTCVRAKSSCTAWFLPEAEVEKLLCTVPQSAMNYIKFLSEKIRFLNQKVTGFSAGSAESKVAFYLLSREKDGCVPVRNFSELASSLSMGRASLYRVLDRFLADGALLKQENQILILNKNYLERIQQ